MLPIVKRFYWVFIFVAILLINGPALHGPFVLDDTHTIENNAHIQNGENIGKIWTSGRYYSSLPATWGYRPLTTTSNLLLWKLSGGKTWSFHLFKWVTFFFICFLILQIWKKLLPSIPQHVFQVCLLLFAINPVHSQLLNYISATSSLLATLFSLLAVYFYLRAREFGYKGSWLWLSGGSVFLATMAKEEGVSAIACLLAVEVYLQWRDEKKITFVKLTNLWVPMLTVIFGVFLIFYHYESTQSMARSAVGAQEYFITQWRAYLRYFAMFFWSYDLNADNLAFEFSDSILDWKVLLALSINLILVGFSLYKLRTWPLLALVLFWFYAAVAPSSSVVPLSEPVNDHRALLAYVGLAMLLCYWMWLLFQKNKNIYWALSFILIVSYSSFSFNRAQVWSSKVKLWTETAKKNPLSGRAHNNLATALMEVGDYSQALRAIEDCLKVTSIYSYCYTNKGIILAHLGKDQSAEENFAKAVSLDSQYVSSRLFWAQYLNSRGFLMKAKQLLREADQFTAGYNLQVRLELINTLYRMGLNDEATTLKAEAFSRFGKIERLKKLDSL